ncbi:uncharacterized protein LOC131164501 isoform X2 [Malania oleifera]|nr:uncharacterized protein LOC131164501 isoform X2 [Malania oleifera]XP_057977734.1 uncharacterized protein LOC131164501 isoform X2 [Malania oleifera]XP_057977735.1 uncharacterized protein LOC131164501 isoform X2 [Malania oleifera]
MGSFEVEHTHGSCFSNEKFHVRAEPGTCNLYSIPCSSCMHLNQMTSQIGTMASEFLKEACQGKTPSHCYFHDTGLLSPSKSSVCNDRQHASSETSNLLSVCSSHDPFSENAESKATVRHLDMPEDMKMLSNVTTGNPVAKNHGVLESHDSHSFHGHECHGDSISCISASDGGNVMISDHNGETQRKNLPCGSASVNSLSVELSGKAVSGCPASKLGSGHCKVEALQPAAIFPNKSDPSEVTSLRDLYAVASSLMEPSESSMEPVGSSLAKLEANSVDGHKHNACENEPEPVEPTHEAVKCSDEDGSLEKLSSLIEVCRVQDPPLQSHLVGHPVSLDIVEDEVKVCDICGDVGREAYLAVCSKCNDGAEHIYCMRVKMEKVPDGDWICEECTLEYKTEKQKPDKIEKVIGASIGSSIIETCNSDSKISTRVDVKDSNVEKSIENKVNFISQLSAKRPADNLEATSVTKKRAFETTDRTPRRLSPRGKGFLSRDFSSKKLGYNSPSVQPRLQTSPGAPSKSNTVKVLDSKMKVQLPKEDIRKIKIISDSATTDRKKEGVVRMMSKSLSFNGARSTTGRKEDGLVRMMSKSLSFNSARSRCPNATDAKVKMLSPKSYNFEDLKRLRLGKGKNSVRMKNSCKLDHPPASSAMVGSVSSALKADKKIASHHETKSLVSSGSNLRGREAVPSHGTSNSLKLSAHLPHRGSKLSHDMAGSGVKSKSSFSLKAVGAPPSTSCLDSSHKPKPRKVLSKNELPKKRNRPTQTDGLSMPILNLKGRIASKDRFSSNTICCPSGATNEEQGRDVNVVRRNAEASTESVFATKATKSNADIPFAAKSDAEAFTESAFTTKATKSNADIPLAAKFDAEIPSSEEHYGRSFPRLASMMAVPEIDYIWQGGFEMKTHGKLPGFCDRIQAHLSTCASPKVLEVVEKFPCRVLLEEVSRISTWPIQFSENCATEDNIALYFFAEDFESYGRNYKSLLECMIKNDLALKGNVDGIELLIFSSNLLPEKSQRWNNLYFLWGVFKARRTNYPEQNSSPKMIFASGFDGTLMDKNTDDDAQGASSYAASQELPSFSSGRIDAISEPKVFSPNKKLSDLHKNFGQQPIRVDAISLSSLAVRTEPFPSFMNMQCTSTPLEPSKDPVTRKGGYTPCLHTGSNNDKDCGVVDVGRECKKMKSFHGTREHDDIEGIICSSGGLSSGMVSIDPSSPVKDQRYHAACGVEIIQNSRTTSSCSSLTSVDRSLLDDGWGEKYAHSQLKAHLADDEGQMGSPALNLELSLGSEETSMKRGVLPSFSQMMDKKSNREKWPALSYTNNDADRGDKLSDSLSLSLALPR